jgi:hypothetical protein
MKHRKMLLSIADDMRRIYFNLVPAKDADVRAGKTKIRFRDKDVIYEFGGDPLVLLEKHRAGLLGAIWRVRYYDYARTANAFYPRGIVMDNNEFHYRLIVKNRRRVVR